MAEKDHLSRTMRIDLIPDVPKRPGGNQRDRLVIQKPAADASGAGASTDAELEESHFQRLLQRLYDAALIVDRAGQIVEVNARAEEFFRYSQGDLRGMYLADVVSGADETVLRTVADNLENERHTLIQAYCIRQDATLFPAEIAASKLDIGPMHLCFFVRDITIRRQAEEMLITEHNAIQHSGNGIAIVDVEGRLEYANPMMERMWGYSEGQSLLGVDLRDLLVDRTAADNMILELLQGSTESATQDLRARRMDATEFDVQVSGARNRNADGEIVGCVFSLINISDRVRAEEAERESERRRVMLESLGAACHHLGQPATMLLGNLELLEDRTKESDEATRKLVRGSLDAMERLSVVLRRLTRVHEYKTTEYLQADEDADSPGSRILEI